MANLKLDLKRSLTVQRLILFLIISLLLSGVLFASNKISSEQIYIKIFEKYDGYYSEMSKHSGLFYRNLSKKNLSNEQIEWMLEPLTNLQESIRDINLWHRNKEGVDLSHRIVSFYENYDIYKERKFRPSLDIPPFEIERDLNLHRNLIENNFSYEDDEFSLKGTNFLLSSCKKLYGVFFAVFLIILISDIFTGDKQSGLSKIRYLQPKDKKHILISKCIVSLINLIVFVLIFSISAIFICMVFGDGMGSFDYPIEIGPMNYKLPIFKFNWESIASEQIDKNYILKPLWNVLLVLNLNFLGYLFMLVGFMAFASEIFKSKTAILLITCGIAVILHVLSIPYINSWQKIYGYKLPPLPIFLQYPYKFLLNSWFSIIGFIVGILSFILIIFLTNRFRHKYDFSSRLTGKSTVDIIREYEKEKTYGKFITQFRFEILKMIRGRKLILLRSIITVLLIGISVHHIKTYDNLRINEFDKVKSTILRNEELYNANVYDQDYKILLDQYNSIYERMKNGDESAFIDRRLLNIKTDFKNKEPYLKELGYNKNSLILEENIYSELNSRHKNMPLSKSDTSFTIFHEDTGFEEYVSRYLSYLPYHNSSGFIVNSIFKTGLILLVLLIIGLVVWEGISQDDKRNRGFNFIILQPISKTKIMISTYLSQVFSSVLVFIMAIIVMLLLMTTMGVKNETDFPVINYSLIKNITYDNELYKDDNPYIDPFNPKLKESEIYRHNLRYFKDRKISPIENFKIDINFKNIIIENTELVLITISSIILLASVSLIISMYIKSISMKKLIIIIIILFGYFLSTSVLSGGTGLLPFTAINSPFITSGEAYIRYNSILLKPYACMIIQLLWSIILLAITDYVFKKRYS